MENSNEYKNGYNDCIEMIILTISAEISNTKNGDISINDSMRDLRRRVLDRSFSSHPDSKAKRELNYIHNTHD